MRLQSLFLLVVLAVFCEHQCNAAAITEATSTPRHTTTERSTHHPDDWSWHDNYLDDGDTYDSRPGYRDRYDDDAYESRPRNRGRYGNDSYKNRPSRKGYNDDDDDYNKNDDYDKDDDYKKDDDYNKDDDYSKNDDYDKDDTSYERRPSRAIKKPKQMAHMNIYFREPSKDGKRKKPKRFRFPVANYEREHFPRNFGPLLSFMPWLPIFADRLTKQTIIYSPTGGVYILPPVINFYGKLISVAQLIASGYASLVSSGAPPPPAVDVRPLVQPGPVVGPGVPAINPATGGFKGGVRTDFRSLPRAEYPKTYGEKPAYPQRDAPAQPRPGY